MEGVGIPGEGDQAGAGLPPPPQLPPPPGMGAAVAGGASSSKDALLAMVAQGLVLTKTQIKELTQQDKKAGKKAKKAARKVWEAGGGGMPGPCSALCTGGPPLS